MRLNERASCRPSRTKSKHGNDDDGDNDDNDDDLQRAGVTDGQSGDAGTAVAGSELRRSSSNFVEHRWRANTSFLPSFLPCRRLTTADTSTRARWSLDSAYGCFPGACLCVDLCPPAAASPVGFAIVCVYVCVCVCACVRACDHRDV